MKNTINHNESNNQDFSKIKSLLSTAVMTSLLTFNTQVLNALDNNYFDRIDGEFSGRYYDRELKKQNFEYNNRYSNGPDFHIGNAKAKVRQIGGTKDYILENQDIKYIGNKNYILDLKLERDSGSSIRGPIYIRLNFYYDGRKIIFFNDRNGNNYLDNKESWTKFYVKQKNYKKRGRYHYYKKQNMSINLDRNDISKGNGVKELKLYLDF